MRIELTFKLSDTEIPADYRSCIISFIKASLNVYNNELYNALYGSGPVQKQFTFAVRLPSPEFRGDTINLKSDFIHVVVSSDDMFLGIDLYNAFLKMRNKPYQFGKITVWLKTAHLKNHRLLQASSIVVKMMSPLVVRKHIKSDNKDCYFTTEDSDFYEQLNLITKVQLETFCPASIAQDQFSFEALDTRKTVTVLFGQKFACTLGILRITGSNDLLNYLYQAGIGSRRSAGFGFFEVI